ncbi:hypothetical protein [Parasitella parasitica]|uniref:Uncharacterized protein n=1 Tax=Parasitella parasitica TaxID=35722 RepID=A0A0B7N373_9FUNG|nr:hypothetical protein [Parasitella parasitica]
MKYFMETDSNEWDLKKAFVKYLEQNEFATAKRCMVDDILKFIRLPNTSEKASEKAKELLAQLTKDPSAIKSTKSTQSTQASSSATCTDSVVNSHPNIKNQNITINQERNMTSDSFDGVRETKRQKTSASAHALSTTSDRDVIAVSDISAASTTPAQIEKVNRFANRLAMSAWRFRREVYALGVKKLNKSLTDSDKEALAYMISVFQPNNLAEELDMFSARLINDLNLENSAEVNALKLSLSRTVNLVNTRISMIFKKYIVNESFWVEVNNFGIEQPPGLSVESKTLLERIMNNSQNENGQFVLKQLRVNITTEKLEAINEEDEQKIFLLDILETVARNAIADARTAEKSNESELTSYRKVAMILDLMLKNSSIDIVDGETTCKASKTVAKNHENIYGDTIPLNRGFGRRIDLLLSSKNIELSTNEWKRKKIALEQLITQQTKNIRMNKAILSELHKLPVQERDAKHLYTMSMDWVGSKGYVFAIKKIADIYVAVYLKPLSMPDYLFQLPEFLETLDALYSWSCHQIRLEEIILPAAITKERDELFSDINANNTDDENNEVGSPNVYLTPTKTKKNN